MRSSFALTAALLSLAWAVPANTQMCCAAPTAGSTASAPASGGMCGMMRPAATDPGTASSTPSQGQATGGCPCCRNMAMMQPQPGQSTPGMGGMQHMPGMQMPGAPATPTPEPPKQ